MAKLTPQEFAQKHADKTRAASADYERGIRAVTENPAAKAAGAVAKWQQRVNDPVTRDKFTRSLGRVTTEAWKSAAITKGSPRLSQGVDAARPKVEAFASEFLPYLDAGVAQVRAMPKMNLADGIARATAMINYNAKFRRSR